MEQFTLRSRGGMGHLESYYFLPKAVAQRMGLKEEEKPHVRHIDPEVGVWHTVKLTMHGRTFSAEYDGEVLYDQFEYHDWMMNMEPSMLEAAFFVRGDANGDGTQINVADAVFILQYLFANGPEPACLDAADVNDDARVNISDAMLVLANLFQDGSIPIAGVDPTPNDLLCEDTGF